MRRYLLVPGLTRVSLTQAQQDQGCTMSAHTGGGSGALELSCVLADSPSCDVHCTGRVSLHNVLISSVVSSPKRCLQSWRIVHSYLVILFYSSLVSCVPHFESH